YTLRELIAIEFAPTTLTPPIRPPPKGYHWLPSQRAMWLALIPPAVVKPPPTYTSLSLIAMVWTGSSTPLPRADQLLPSHLAMWFTNTPPAVLKVPPTYTSLPLIAIA